MSAGSSLPNSMPTDSSASPPSRAPPPSGLLLQAEVGAARKDPAAAEALVHSSSARQLSGSPMPCTPTCSGGFLSARKTPATANVGRCWTAVPYRRTGCLPYCLDTADMVGTVRSLTTFATTTLATITTLATAPASATRSAARTRRDPCTARRRHTSVGHRCRQCGRCALSCERHLYKQRASRSCYDQQGHHSSSRDRRVCPRAGRRGSARSDLNLEWHGGS